MQNSGVKTWRVCARKLPPTLSEDEFLKTDLIANYIENKIISVKYYPAEAIGDTSAPASSMAIITITADDLTFKKFTDALSQQTFKMTYCEPKTAQIELAPCQNLSVRYNQQQANNSRQMIPIDKDPEFIEFSSKFEESYTPPADAVLEKLEIDSDDQFNAENNLNIMSQKLNGGKINSNGPNGSNAGGPGGGRPKRIKNRNKKSRYAPGDGNHQ